MNHGHQASFKHGRKLIKSAQCSPGISPVAAKMPFAYTPAPILKLMRLTTDSQG
ncbi:hypothetical protein CA54_47010 [Symmachiella macrocystis]|uniref:Uncharacterized protein n=1 Tax=Symmachiella macrocystis TaxID=2527985 RepID=A0A5C6BDU1_9PLAN|nr:hypothetical protein CA54_47010 [Symmachiella macrocystis]